MELINILLPICIFLLFEKSVFCELKFEVKVFKSITMVRNDGNIPYIKKHPEANTDRYTEEKRLQLCRTGFDYVLKHEKGKSFQLTKVEKLEKLETYVLVNPAIPEDKSDDEIEIRPAYQCPTTPPTFIHVDCDSLEENEPSFWVIFKDSGPPFNFNQINEYFLQLVEEIREVNAEEIADISEDNIDTSECNSDGLSEEQRLQMCRRVMNLAPEMGAHFLDNTKCEKSKYYAIIDDQVTELVTDSEVDTEFRVSDHTSGTETGERSTNADEDLENEDGTDSGTSNGDSEETDISNTSSDNGTIQAFKCPTVPEIYVSVLLMDKGENTLWAIVKKDEIKQRPAFDIVAYELIIANSIHKIVGENENTPDSKWQQVDPPSRKTISKLIKSLNLNDIHALNDDVREVIYNLEKTSRKLESLEHKSGPTDAEIDSDELTESGRRFICEKAMKTVLGYVKFIEGNTGQSQFYQYFKNKEIRYLMRLEKYELDDIVKAFRCPTQPVAYIRLAKTLSKNVAQVIVSGRDLALSLMRFK